MCSDTLASCTLHPVLPQLFGYRMAFCDNVLGSEQLCPPGLTYDDCPSHFDCYLPCEPTLAGSWFGVPNSPYGGQAYCEQFPRQPGGTIAPDPDGTQYEYLAQVGKSTVPNPNFDNIFKV